MFPQVPTNILTNTKHEFLGVWTQNSINLTAIKCEHLCSILTAGLRTPWTRQRQGSLAERDRKCYLSTNSPMKAAAFSASMASSSVHLNVQVATVKWGRRRQGNMPLWIHPVNECRKLAFSRIFTLFTSKMWIIHKLVCNSVITNTIQHTSWRVTLSSSWINTVQGLLYTQCAGSTLLRNDSNYLPYGIRGAHSGWDED